ncbi:MAG: hypothetical protein M1828_001147 [Chrysothrix sp. TS-e1954]|nr:MAG: hypothetical protein M1828_001147 [Chrysothrix sp. TS-e1954]
MYSIAVVSVLAAIAAAVPTPGQGPSISCAGTSSFPWFINPQTSVTCTAANIAVEPASGPAPGRVARCQPLNAQNPAETFVAAAVNTPCTDEKFIVTLHTTPDCTDAGFVAPAGGSCMVAPKKPFLKYSAVPAK